METTVVSKGVHIQCITVQHCANNGEFSIFRAVLRCNAPRVAGA